MFDTVSLPASELLLGKLISYLRAYQNYLKKRSTVGRTIAYVA